MSATAQFLQNNQLDNTQVTAISSLARVDYILRFSKHAVVVIDENPSEYSPIGSQFLANLSSERNAAYLTVSNKLDDVQIRCRIVEQLFGQVLFDPEQSLAVSMVNLSKQQPQPLTIVVEHAHHLSFQLVHELCQLAEIAKKASLDIQVVMLARPEIGVKMNQHTLLFHKKLSIISATTGQLISLSHKSFQQTSSGLRVTIMAKWLIALVLLIVMAAVVIFQLYQMENFKFSQLSELSSASSAPLIVSQQGGVAEKQKSQFVDKKVELSTPLNESASPAEIKRALLAINMSDMNIKHIQLSTEVPKEPAAPSDIMQILTSSNEPEKPTLKSSTEQAQSIQQKVQTQQPMTSSALEELETGKSPFLVGKGLVFQLSVVSNEKVIEQTQKRLENFGVLRYQKLVGKNVMTVFTSPIFDTRDQAERFRQSLPDEFANGGGFIKPLSAIKAEINAFERSQSAANHVTIPTS